MKKVFLSLFILFFISLRSYGLDIWISSIEYEGEEATVVINDLVKIKGIKIKEDEVEFPLYVSDSGRVYERVGFRCPLAKKKVVKALLNNETEERKSAVVSYEISSPGVFKGRNPHVAGFADFVLNDVLEINLMFLKGRGPGEYRVVWPAEKKKNKEYERRVFIKNRGFEKLVEADAAESFKRFVSAAELEEKEIKIIEGCFDTPLAVTAVRGGGLSAPESRADIDLNYAWRIRDVELHEREGEFFVVFPSGRGKRGESYPYMRIFLVSLREEIKRALVESKASEEKYDEVCFEIGELKRNLYESAVQYRGKAIINNALEISFSVIDSEDYDAFVSWPSARDNEGRYTKKVYPFNRGLAGAMEKEILEKYRRALKDEE
ncbi:MAG: hypothetical protein ACQESB_06045 [Elusimicrobiota bacterium]